MKIQTEKPCVPEPPATTGQLQFQLLFGHSVEGYYEIKPYHIYQNIVLYTQNHRSMNLLVDDPPAIYRQGNLVVIRSLLFHVGRFTTLTYIIILSRFLIRQHIVPVRFFKYRYNTLSFQFFAVHYYLYLLPRK